MKVEVRITGYQYAENKTATLVIHRFGELFIAGAQVQADLMPMRFLGY